MIKKLFICAALCGIWGSVFAEASNTPVPLSIGPAHAWSNPTQSMLLDAANAGSRIVAVGEHGIILLSDDGGRSYRQAKQVPAAATLSAVYFSDALHGWAVGQWGVILSTIDGGENWVLERADTAIDQPLFSVYFEDGKRGWAVGLWSLLLATSDGGRTWSVSKLPPPPGGGKADRNLYRVFGDRRGNLYVAAEQGMVLRSRDDGATWEYRQTGNKGSFWAGTVAEDGSVFVGGLLGHMYRSRDRGDTWEVVDSGASGSITDLVSSGDEILGTGVDGFVISGSSNASHFSARQRPDRAELTALLVSHGKTVLFSKSGVSKDN